MIADLRTYVVRPTLQLLNPEIAYTESSVELVMRTGAQETQFNYLDQLGPGEGPGFGFWQMEKFTHDDLWATFLNSRPALAAKVRLTMAPWPVGAEQLHTNVAYGAAMCRVRYYRAPEHVPAIDDIAGMANFWKLRYNAGGRGTVAEFIANAALVRV